MIATAVPPIEQFMPLIHKMSHRTFEKLPVPREMEYDDLISEAGLCYCAIRDRYNPARAKFITIFWLGLARHFHGLVRSAYRQNDKRPDRGFVEFLRLRRNRGREDIYSSEGIEKQMADMFLQVLSRRAWLFTRDLMDPTVDYLAWEWGRYARFSSNPRVLKGRVFRYMECGTDEQRSILMELRDKLGEETPLVSQ